MNTYFNKLKIEYQGHTGFLQSTRIMSNGQYSSLSKAFTCCLFFCAAFMIAGNTAEYVNSELEKVAKRLVSERSNSQRWTAQFS